MAAPRIDASALWRHAEAIAAWSRETAGPGEARAFDYIEAQLTRIGVATARGSSVALVSLPGRAELTVDGRAVAAITHAMAAATPPEGVAGELVAAAAGAAQLEGRIAVFEGLATARAVRRSQEAGARAALFLGAGPLLHEMIVSDVWGSPEPAQLGRLPQLPAASVGGEAAEALRARLAHDGAPPRARLVAEVDTGWREIPLLTAEIRAPAPCGEQFVLLSGHVDSWHLGAMDNAGANAAMIELARVGQAAQPRLRRHLRLAFWSGHSHGRYAGSAAYVDRHWDELDRGCVVHLNVDSLGGRGATMLTRAPSTAATHRVGAEAIAAVSGQALARVPMPRAGDQSLANLGVPALFLTLSEQPDTGAQRPGGAIAGLLPGAAGGGLGWWWHTPQDTLDKLDRGLLARDAEVYRHALLALACDPVVPLDLAAAAVDVDERLRAIAARCAQRLDLGAPLAVSEQVVALARAAMGIVATARRRPRQRAPQARLDAALLAASRPLVRLAHAEGDRFAHDPAGPHRPLPLLAPVDELLACENGSSAAHAWEVLLARRRNRVLAELRLAAEALASIARPAAGRAGASP